MPSHPARVVSAVVLGAIAAWTAGLFTLSRPLASPPVSAAPSEFDARSALATTAELVTRHPRRVLGSLEARQSSGTVKKRLESLGYAVEYEHFDAVIGGRRQNGRNLWAVRRGESSDAIAVVAHYDTAPSTLGGAVDNAAGVGVLLELARIWAAASPRRTLLFLASDGEEWGMLGARDFVRRFPGIDRVVAAVSLDGVAPGEFEGIELHGVGEGRGFAPAWLRELTIAAVRSGGLAVEDASGFGERLSRALALAGADQGPFVAAGIPAVNLHGRGRDRARERGIYHSAADKLENLEL